MLDNTRKARAGSSSLFETLQHMQDEGYGTAWFFRSSPWMRPSSSLLPLGSAGAMKKILDQERASCEELYAEAYRVVTARLCGAG